MTREEALNKYPNGWMEEGGYNDYPKDEIVNKIYDDLESRVCDNCKHRVFHSYDGYKKVTIDKCDIRDKLHFNGSCDGMSCDKFERKLNDNK